MSKYGALLKPNNFYSFQHKCLDHYAIFGAALLLQLHSTPSLMLILSMMESHHIGHSTIFSMMHNMSLQDQH